MYRFCILLYIVLLVRCTPKGPQTYSSPFIGKSKEFLITTKGKPSLIKAFDNSKAFIYTKKEEYYGKTENIDPNKKPKKVYLIEYIYYINHEGIVYKYQVWRKKQ